MLVGVDPVMRSTFDFDLSTGVDDLLFDIEGVFPELDGFEGFNFALFCPVI